MENVPTKNICKAINIMINIGNLKTQSVLGLQQSIGISLFVGKVNFSILFHIFGLCIEEHILEKFWLL